MPRLACGSLRHHDPHDWLGRGYLSYDLQTAETYHCGGTMDCIRGNRQGRIVDNTAGLTKSQRIVLRRLAGEAHPELRKWNSGTASQTWAALARRGLAYDFEDSGRWELTAEGRRVAYRLAQRAGGKP